MPWHVYYVLLYNKYMSKYKYYFKQPRSEIIKDVLSVLAASGLIAIAATSPYFIENLIKGFKKLKKYPNKKIYDSFYNLKRKGLIEFYEKNNQIYISLTKKGKQKAGWMQINDLRINKPKKWDGLWRVLLFDIPQSRKMHREAFRGKLIQLGFKLYQKSVWVIPYKCDDEIGVLKSFFALSDKDIRLLIVKNIEGEENLKKRFSLGT